MKAHWKDQDYGIIDLPESGYFVIKINYIHEHTGDTKIHIKTSYYHSEKNKEWAKGKAIRIRDALLERDDVKKYIASVYAAPDRDDTLSRIRGNDNGKLPELSGISVSTKSKKLASGKTNKYYSIRCDAPLGNNAGTKSTSFSVYTHGLRGSLEKAVKWRCDRLGSSYPEASVIDQAVEKLRNLYPDMPFQGIPKKKHESSIEP